MSVIDRRKLKIGYIEDCENHLKAFRIIMHRHPSELKNLSDQFNGFLYERKKDTFSEDLEDVEKRELKLIINKLVEQDNDLVIVDYYLPISGIRIAEKIKEFKPETKVILFTGGSKKADEEIEKFKSASHKLEEKIIESVVDKVEKPDKILSKIRELCWKPINVGLIGLGSFGIELLRILSRSDDIK